MAAPLYMDGGPMNMQALIDSLQGRRRFPIDDPVAGYQPATDSDAKPPPYAPPQFMAAPWPGRTPQDMIDEAERAKSAFQPPRPSMGEQLGDIAAKTGQVGKAVATAPVNMVRNLYDKVAAQQAAERSPSASSDVYADPRAVAKDPDVPATALGLMGAGVPFAKPGTMGITGGKLVSSMAERNAALAKGAPLTKEQRALVSQFIGDDPYGNSLTVNPNLRAGTPLDPKAQSMADAMDAALASAPRSTAETTLYRGAPAQYSGGHEPAFLSTTKDKGVAEEFADNLPEGGAVHKVIVPKGTPLLETHPFQDEGMHYQKEVILPRRGSLSPTGNAGEFRYSPPAEAPAEPVAPFYSAVEQALVNAKLEKAPLDQWHNYLKGQPGVKAEELNQLGLTPGALPNQSMTKAQLQEHLDANRVQLKEVTKGGPPISDYGTMDEIDSLNSRMAAAPKYHSYQLPGATNYGETLLTLPKDTQFNKFMNEMGQKYKVDPSNMTNAGKLYRDLLTKEERQKWDKLGLETPDNDVSYRSSHWDEPNVLAHVRHNDRQVPSPSGEGTVPSLHLEEVQSDWHQAGRKQGYKQEISPEVQAQIDKLSQQRTAAGLSGGNAAAQRYSDLNRQISHLRGIGAIPDAPFKDTWPDLALKRMLHKAATEKNPDGSFKYHAMSWTPGEAQAARYDLSKQVHEVNAVKYNDGTYGLTAVPKGQTLAVHLNNEAIPEAKLADVIGKDLAEKIIKQEPGNYKKYSGVDLKVGGEGMKTFYDKMLVDKANALGKRYGARVGQTPIETNQGFKGKYQVYDSVGHIKDFESKADAQAFIDARAQDFTPRGGRSSLEIRKSPDIAAINQKVHILPITSELRAAAAKGFPLFALGAVAAPALAQRQLPPMDDRAAKALATKPPDVGLGR